MAAVTVERSALFADIAGSTRIVVEQGDETGRVLLVRYVGLLAATARANGGEVANLLGDEVFCIFKQPNDAAEAAAAMHQDVERASLEDHLARPIRIRTGFVHGSVVRSEEGYFGGTVHKAARLVALAKAGQILTTRPTLDRLDERWRRTGRYFGRHVLRGGSGEDELHELLWDESFTAIEAPADASSSGVTVAVDLAYGDRQVRVDAEHPRAELGRDPACDLRVTSDAVSRLHAAVEWNRGRAQLSDVSTNGTTIERTGAAPVHLRHESAPLEGEGVLYLGVGPASEARMVIYRCRSGA